MRRPPPREEPPRRRFRRDPPRPDGPFDRLLRTGRERDPAPLIIGGTVAFLAVVIFVVLVFSSLLGRGSGSAGGGGGGGGGETDGTLRAGQGVSVKFGQIPSLPPGLESVSEYVLFKVDKNNVAPVSGIEVPLRQDLKETKGLGFYTFFDSRWQRVADVKAIEGRHAKGEFTVVPENVAVLRVKGQTYQVAGSLPSGGSLHPDARVNILNPRDYTPAADGSVPGKATSVAASGDVQLMPTIVGSGRDSAAVVNKILADKSLREQHIQGILKLAGGSDIKGIDLEYSSVDGELESEFTDFIAALADKLHNEQKRLSLTLPPPSNQRQAYNWKALGQAADIIKILPIANPEGYWETMPGAISQVVGDVDPAKIMLVVSPFSVEGSGSSSRPIGFLHALVLAAEATVREPQNPNDIKPGATVKLVANNLDEGEGASPIRWDDSTATLSFALGGTERKRIFIENSFSVTFKLEIVQAYGLGGVALSDASAQSDVADVWPIVNGLVDSATVTLRRPNDSNLLPIWQAPDGGDLGAGAGTSATWVPKKAGPHNLILVVSDGGRRFGRKIPLEVKEAPEPSASPLVTFPPDTATPRPIGSATPTPSPEFTLKLQVGKRVDANGDGVYSNDEQASGSQVTYRVVIDNDSNVPVKITSVVDDTYPGITCKEDTNGDHVPDTDVLGRTLQPDDGDGSLVDEFGPDAVVCFFDEPAPTLPSQVIKDTVTVVIKDSEGNKGADSDDAKVRAPPTPTP